MSLGSDVTHSTVTLSEKMYISDHFPTAIFPTKDTTEKLLITAQWNISQHLIRIKNDFKQNYQSCS